MTQTPGPGGDDLTDVREGIRQLEASDQEFARKANTLLDQLIVIGDRIDRSEQRIDRYIEQSRAEREADRERLNLIEVRLDVDREHLLEQEQRFERFIQQAESDRAVMLRILEHLENRYPGNGRGGTND